MVDNTKKITQKDIDLKEEKWRIIVSVSSIGMLLILISIICIPDIGVIPYSEIPQALMYSLFNLDWYLTCFLILAFVSGVAFYLSFSEMKIVKSVNLKIRTLTDENVRLESKISEFEKTAHKSSQKSKSSVLGETRNKPKR